jgi:hypothetical protein
MAGAVELEHERAAHRVARDAVVVDFRRRFEGVL